MTRVLRTVAVAALLASACSPADDPPTIDDGPPALVTMSVEATDDGEGGGYGFTLPDAVPVGATRIELSNSGNEVHHLQVFSVREGTTLDDVRAGLDSPDSDLVEVVRFIGGTGGVEPQTTSKAEAVVDLTEGSYVFVCFIEGPSGPHHADGMFETFHVPAADAYVPAPPSDGVVGLTDDGQRSAYELPEVIDGDDTLRIENRSEDENHEMNIVAMPAGASETDLVAFVSGEAEPGYAAVGGMQTLSPGETSTLELDLAPGTYGFVCFVPSSRDGEPQFRRGMVATVEIG